MDYLDYTGELESLASVGNVSGGLPERRVFPYGHFDLLPKLILKEYAMEERVHAPSDRVWDDVHRLIAEEVEAGNLDAFSGLGFSILSNSILNVCGWHSEYTDVIVPRIYALEDGSWISQTVEVAGAFCSGEKRVYDHENRLWTGYLNSEKTNADKLIYLNDFLRE